ncbi:MAG: hypothetical protein EA423_08020 [Phycisphaerales bacterium]|nr:MAG: hypothetical protein EA423_08020 [Phycisphaerales bacterium]
MAVHRHGDQKTQRAATRSVGAVGVALALALLMHTPTALAGAAAASSAGSPKLAVRGLHEAIARVVREIVRPGREVIERCPMAGAPAPALCRSERSRLASLRLAHEPTLRTVASQGLLGLPPPFVA